ncbi:enoyl-CoA hydratase [Corynebacterium pelargi]|uniref:Putative enoyl-CoA hydratase echA6 n=1 Tax=Corynebacterium pelargi TaxID=1471400 RepID=A0A410WA21_9CORY|nr:enoyl-CoA hydratase [Corynebacterium pelargi]QAU52823.1 putative enoyl-CoA hydratase echA6 [Corynebacterium pelargi]GGG79010.1 putative enoyl-CoA hydratase echA6 [Corynebacterium pelargi]
MSDQLKQHNAGTLLEIQLHRPEKRNALNAQLCQEITAALHTAAEAYEQDRSVRAVLISGDERAFCAGADLGGQGEGVYGDGFLTHLHTMLQTIVNLPMPVIANVQGPAVGAGTQLALACDLRVVGDRGWFSVPAAALGFALDAWTIHRAQDLLGGSVARQMLLGAARIEAARADALGFAHRGDDEAARSYAQEMTTRAPLAVEQLKVVLNADDASYGLSPRAQDLFQQCWSSEDAQEARRARAEKRPPEFRGR